jgi:hypothetical protein
VLIVTGTKRSGTSLWMQILIAAGFPAFGEAFPGEWQTTLAKANRDGFYESLLREGVYYATNPHPRTGDYFFPEQVQWHAVKVFVPGLVRTDRAFIGRVVATVREWREHEASLLRLRDIESAQRDDRARAEHPPELLPPLEWWSDNFALVRDIAVRRYPVHVQSYDGLISDPEAVIGRVLTWLGKGEIERAAARVRPERRTFERIESNTVEPEIATVFDELYDAIHSGSSLSPDFLEKLNETNEALKPLFLAHREKLARFLERSAERNGPS